MFFIEVVLPLAVAKTFTYQVSQAEYAFVQQGMRVAVPFGKTKIYTALILNKHQQEPLLYQAKEIHQILDTAPVVTSIQIQHWQWISEYYMCSLGKVFKCALPSALLLESETIIYSNQSAENSQDQLTDDEFLILEALSFQTQLKIEDVASILHKKNVLPVVQILIQKQLISVKEELQELFKPKLIKYIKLHDNYATETALSELLDTLKGAKQKEIILYYFQLKSTQKKPIAASQITHVLPASTLKTLVEKNIFEEYYVQEDRVSFTSSNNVNNLLLSTAQQKAYEEIGNNFQNKNAVLLHGITASGKTEIYIKLINDCLLQNKQVLFLVPEIALTTQLVSRLTAYFGNLVSVFHSKYSNNERVEVWNNLLANSDKSKIIIGARSALFLPFQDLGLIIIDEEHEPSFKQTDPAPRYHTRDAAMVLASSYKSKVLLGSATPSIETYYNALSGKYGLVTLSERYSKTPLPEIVLVDLKDAYFRKKMTGHFSSLLLDEIAQSLGLGEQVILFQNRRGFAPVLECITCGHVPQCPNCDVSLTYHKFKNQLRCHYCGYAIAKPTNCHVCASVDLSTKGFGTEQIELELAELFPNANIKRMDQDTTRGKNSFENLIHAFKNREIDVLVGTQMLAKGLDFDNVSLVGIMNADNMLYYPDFRAFERSYQMMTQVSGRAGRGEKQGKVVIQTYNPLHNIIQQVSNQDYLGMYKEQLYERQIFKYPPYCRLVKFTLKNRDYEKLKEASFWLYNVLKQHLDIPVLGPEEPAVSKIRNEYIRTILIKLPYSNQLIVTKKTIQKILNSFETISQYKSVKIAINVDFY
ncbi:replication restart DNA helicase PriA [Flavobacterium croceum DSM 17960]|uniref:Replication restart protein PriA n=1 Tax=Flavobacterium croceum DSM 17960 TaxID=1121886 RepID=A0A2S4N627_9FLAO|nr:primosomal protein N' [Flavobacterium croceum]POS01175.1 replication restart DNA helicase PriA [Flavobacterium croceum DSM 17960]